MVINFEDEVYLAILRVATLLCPAPPRAVRRFSTLRHRSVSLRVRL